MARKVKSRKKAREEAEAAEAAETTAKKAKKAKKKKAAKKRKSRAKAAADVRVKIFWGVFNHAMKRVALFEFNQKKAAVKKAKDMSPEGKPPHFVAKVKEEVQETEA